MDSQRNRTLLNLCESTAASAANGLYYRDAELTRMLYSSPLYEAARKFLINWNIEAFPRGRLLVKYPPSSNSTSAPLVTSYTHTFAIETAHSETNQTEVTEKITLNFPSQPITQVWQRMKQIALYRTDGTRAASVTYKIRDYLFRPEGTTKQGGQ